MLPVGHFLYRKYKEHRLLKQMTKAGIHDIDKLDGHQFEIYLKVLVKELGYRSDVTQGSRDFGANLNMKNDKKKVNISPIHKIYSTISYLHSRSSDCYYKQILSHIPQKN